MILKQDIHFQIPFIFIFLTNSPKTAGDKDISAFLLNYLMHFIQ